jgi:hypothetical protein
MEISIRTIRANELPQNGTRNAPKGLYPAIFEPVNANIELREGMNEGRREGGNGASAAREGPDSSNGQSMKRIYRMNDAHVHPPCRSGGPERHATGG